MNDLKYKSKYLKYKSKYLKYKQVGGDIFFNHRTVNFDNLNNSLEFSELILSIITNINNITYDANNIEKLEFELNKLFDDNINNLIEILQNLLPDDHTFNLEFDLNPNSEIYQDSIEKRTNFFNSIYKVKNYLITDISILRENINNRLNYWDDLTINTIRLKSLCTRKRKIRYKMELNNEVYITDNNYEIMYMYVNLLNIEYNKEQKLGSEHIYIYRNPIYLILEYFKLYTRIPNLAYKLHMYAILSFQPDYIFTDPLKSINSVFDTLVKNNILSFSRDILTIDNDKKRKYWCEHNQEYIYKVNHDNLPK